MEPKEAINVLAHALNLHTEQQKSDLRQMLIMVYGYEGISYDTRMDNKTYTEQRFEERMQKDLKLYQTFHTAKHEGLSVRQIMKELDIGQYKYYAELPYVETGSKEDTYLHRNDLDLSPIERVLELAKTYPIL
jgi:hypothetical protein